MTLKCMKFLIQLQVSKLIQCNVIAKIKINLKTKISIETSKDSDDNQDLISKMNLL